jgi:hypothetical protein
MEEAFHMEGLLRKRMREGAVVLNLRLVSLTAAVSDAVDQAVQCVTQVFQSICDGWNIVPEEIAEVRFVGRQLCVVSATDDAFGFLAPYGKRVIDVAVKAIKMELPPEELREMLRALYWDLEAIRKREVIFPKRPFEPFAHEGGAANVFIVSSLAEVKAYLKQQYDEGRSPCADSSVVLTGMVLQDAPTAHSLLLGYSETVKNWELLEALMYVDQFFVYAEAEMDHMKCKFTATINGENSINGYNCLDGEGDMNKEYPSSPAERLLILGEEIARLGHQAPGFDSLALLGERLAAAARLALSSDFLHVHQELVGLLSAIEESKGIWFPFPAISIT